MSIESFNFGERRRVKRMSLTPMIDVVFLLLIFFMLSSRFGVDAVLPITAGAKGTGSEWQGAPRLIDVKPDGLALNGVPIVPQDLAAALTPLIPEEGGAVIVRPQDNADLQRLVDVLDDLHAQGFLNVILVE